LQYELRNKPKSIKKSSLRHPLRVFFVGFFGYSYFALDNVFLTKKRGKNLKNVKNVKKRKKRLFHLWYFLPITRQPASIKLLSLRVFPWEPMRQLLSWVSENSVSNSANTVEE